MLAYFTQIDYDRDMALVAIDKTHPKERLLGVARFMTKLRGSEPEFAAAVGDPWQGKGVGAILMEHLISIAKERGIESVGGIVLPENTHMLALAKKLGFDISWSTGEGCYQLKKDLRSKVSG
jgi:acetyltransferase